MSNDGGRSSALLITAVAGGTVVGGGFAVFILGHPFGSSTAMWAGLGYLVGCVWWVVFDQRYGDSDR
jgi:hypothetical protein